MASEAGIIEEAGLVVGPGLAVALRFNDRRLGDEGYCGWLDVADAVSALSDACLLVLRILVVGRDGVSYGTAPPHGRTWKGTMLDELRGAANLDRVHFLGRLDHADYLSVLGVWGAHVYLTYPFVLSWSLLEAMAAECPVIVSATGPVREVVDPGNGVLVDFFDVAGLSDAIVAALEEPDRSAPLRREARRTVLARYRKQDCVARMVDIVTGGRDA